MIRVFVDIDETLADYSQAYHQALKKHPNITYPQSIKGFFSDLSPITGAIDGYKNLEALGFDVWILSAPSYLNPHCYSEKRLWVEKHLGLDTCKKLILSYDKSLLIGDYLIDDHTSGKGQENFTGEMIHFRSTKFPDWPSITEYFESTSEIS